MQKKGFIQKNGYFQSLDTGRLYALDYSREEMEFQDSFAEVTGLADKTFKNLPLKKNELYNLYQYLFGISPDEGNPKDNFYECYASFVYNQFFDWLGAKGKKLVVWQDWTDFLIEKRDEKQRLEQQHVQENTQEKAAIRAGWQQDMTAIFGIKGKKETDDGNSILSKVETFKDLFKDPAQLDRILQLRCVTDCLNPTTGEWIEKRRGPRAYALVSVLNEKGYLKPSDGVLNSALFNAWFGTSYSTNTFQGGRNSAHTWRFGCIPDAF